MMIKKRVFVIAIIGVIGIVFSMSVIGCGKTYKKSIRGVLQASISMPDITPQGLAGGLKMYAEYYLITDKESYKLEFDPKCKFQNLTRDDVRSQSGKTCIADGEVMQYKPSDTYLDMPDKKPYKLKVFYFECPDRETKHGER
ncbi:MAG: hypothetical protein JW976_01960 [Syntrophaceae bacterium]|nr:hypothetical protein [Syntrophaceae bacterium]